MVPHPLINTGTVVCEIPGFSSSGTLNVRHRQDQIDLSARLIGYGDTLADGGIAEAIFGISRPHASIAPS